MGTIDFKTHIKQIRKEALELGFSIKTMDGYLFIWNKFIQYKNEDNFVYNEDDYINFLLDYYNFDIKTYTNKSKSRHQQLMRSKRILDNFNSYKENIKKRALPNALYCEYPNNWEITLDNYLTYLKDIRNNANNSIKLQRDYLIRILSYFNQHNIKKLEELEKKDIINFINDVIDAGDISKRRNFYALRIFLNYLFIEGITNNDLSIYVPKCKNITRKKLPTYLKQNEVESLLKSIPRNTKCEIRDYSIILIAARLGLRISDILNIKLKDIDWKNNKFTVVQPKTNNLNILPLSNEVGWSIINYIKNSRPKCNNEYLFVKFKYPFEKMDQFHKFHKYFEKTNIEKEENTMNGIHNLRHSLASNLLNQETSIDIIANILGNTIEICSNIYININEKKLRECALEVDNEL